MMNKKNIVSTKGDAQKASKSDWRNEVANAKPQSQTKLRIDADGKITLPKQLLARIGVRPESEFLVKEVSGAVVLMPMIRWSSLVESFKQKIEKRLKDAGIKGDEPIFASLTAEEYAALSEEEADALWEELYAEASQKVKYEEVEVGKDFIPT